MNELQRKASKDKTDFFISDFTPDRNRDRDREKTKKAKLQIERQKYKLQPPQNRLLT